MQTIEKYTVELINLASFVVEVEASSLVEAQSRAWAERESADFNMYNEDCCFVLAEEKMIPCDSGYLTGFRTVSPENLMEVDTSPREYAVGDRVIVRFETKNGAFTRYRAKILRIDESYEDHITYEVSYFDEKDFKMIETWCDRESIVF